MVAMNYVGVDPGKKGALAILSEDTTVDVIPMPQKGNIYDAHGIAEQLHLWYKLFGALHVTVEALQQLPPYRKATPQEIRRQLQRTGHSTGVTQLGGGKANFERGCAKCGWDWLLATFQLFRPNLTYGFVHPQRWQKAMFTDLASKDPKAASLLNAKRLFPGVRLIPPRGRVENHNYSDALLLALYGKRVAAGKV